MLRKKGCSYGADLIRRRFWHPLQGISSTWKPWNVNRAIFERALRNTPEDRIPYLSREPEEYKFRKSVWLFDGLRWTTLGEVPEAALAGPGVAATASGLLVTGGELKPGVRSPKTFIITL